MFVKPAQSQIQLVVRVFTDDFTASLSRFTSIDIKLDPDQLSETVVSGHISNYFQHHFQLKSPKESAVFSFVGWEYKNDQTILYASYDSLQFAREYLEEKLLQKGKVCASVPYSPQSE